MAGCVLDGAPAPPILKTAQMYRAWGIGDPMELPAGLLPQMQIALNVYDALTSYKSSSGRSVEWTKRNPDAWRLVSAIIAERKRVKRGAE